MEKNQSKESRSEVEAALIGDSGSNGADTAVTTTATVAAGDSAIDTTNVTTVETADSEIGDVVGSVKTDKDTEKVTRKLKDTHKEKDRNRAKTALKMYEKAVRLSQNLGWDIINNWTRKYMSNFEFGELNKIIIRYWYLPDDNDIIETILHCIDCIETNFIDNKEKMKQSKILSSIVPDGSNLRRVILRDDVNIENDNDIVYTCNYITVRKPGKLDKMLTWATKTSQINLSNYGTMIYWFNMDLGRIIRIGEFRYTDGSKKIEFNQEYAAKLMYCVTFMSDEVKMKFDQMKKNDMFNINMLSFEMKIFSDYIEFEYFLINLLIHYCFRALFITFPSIMDLIRESEYLSNISIDKLGDEAEKQFALDIFGHFCDKLISDDIDGISIDNLNSPTAIDNIKSIFYPSIVASDENINDINNDNCSNRFDGNEEKDEKDEKLVKLQLVKQTKRIKSINGEMVEVLTRDNSNVKEFIWLCYMIINDNFNVISNCKEKFKRWDHTDAQEFSSILAYCCLHVYSKIAKHSNVKYNSNK